MITREKIIASVWAALAMVLVGSTLSASGDTVAHWRFEEGPPGSFANGEGSVLDSVGDHHGTPMGVGGPIYVSSPTLNGDLLGLHFDGVDDFVFVPDAPAFVLTESLTLEAFVVVHSYDHCPTTDHHQIVFYGDERGQKDPYRLDVRHGDGRFGFAVETESGTISRVYSPEPAPLGELVHVAGTLNDATGQQKLFINGHEVASTVTGVRPFGPLDPGLDPGIGIGNIETDTWKTYFNGAIAEVRISDVALEPNELLFPPLFGDLNGDGFVGQIDLGYVLTYWGQTVAMGDPLMGDPSGDGLVSQDDLDMVLADWGGGSPPAPPSVPESATLSLLTLGGLALMRRKRK